MDNLKKMMKFLQNDNIFLTGGGGVGKSYLCNEIINKYKENKKQIITLGSTGISAVHIGGQTLHSFFSFGISKNIQETLINDKKFKRKLKEVYEIISKCDLLIIDEISMVSSDVMDMIDYRLKNGNFKGKILFVGDFFQLPPVNKNSSNGLFSDNIYAFESSSWQYYNPKIIMLDIPKRTEDKDFFDILNHIRVGETNDRVLNYLEKLRQNYDVWEDNPTVLFGRNKEADIMNINRLNQIQSQLFTFHSVLTIHDVNLHVNKIDNWKKALNVNEVLELKIGANVLFCANKKGSYYNGERGEIVAILDDKIDVQKTDCSIVSVARHEYELNEIVNEDDKIREEVLATIEQFPLRLAYAITIHKSQGMSLEKVVCNIDNIFEKSQFYVALSRAVNPEKLFLYYSRNNFLQHIQKSIEVDKKVKDFYENCDSIYIERLKDN